MPLDGSQLNPAVQHLINAKNYLQEHGWCPNGAGGEGGTVCIATAIAITTTGDRFPAEVISAISRTIGVHPPIGVAIGVWNDAPGRTIEEVLDAFDRAIALAMEEDNAS